MVKEIDKELVLMLKTAIADAKTELKERLPKFDLTPDVSDADIKQSIFDMTPPGWEKLYAQFGQGEVIRFINEFTRSKKW